MKKEELKAILNEKVIEYTQPKIVESDPIQIPHKFNRKEDIEIAAFLRKFVPNIEKKKYEAQTFFRR